MAKIGRPTKYKPEYVQLLRNYFNRPSVVTELIEQDEGEPVAVTHACEFPTLAGFCCSIGVHRATVWRWQDEHEDFCDALKEAKEHQERILVDNALTGRYQTTFCIFAAKNLIDWRDKQEQDVSVKGNVSVEIVRFTDQEPDK